MVAALAAKEAGAEPLLIERDPVPRGSTALSAGLIPAAGTRWQAQAAVADDPALFAADIMHKAHDEPDPAIVDMLTTEVAPTLDWLADRHGLPFSLVADVDYPGHSHRRMHGLPSRTGAELIDRLRAAAEAAGIDMILGRTVTALYAEPDGTVRGVAVTAPDGTEDTVGCRSLVLACNGYGGNRDLVRRHMPAIADALWFGHDGNRGEAVLWGQALGAATRHLGAYQGHGSVAHPEGILISWAVIGAGGFQVNREGHRFWDESQGYSEAARAVLAQPGGVAWSVFDDRCAAIARQFGDFRAAEALHVFRVADSPESLAEACGLPPAAFADTCAAVTASKAGQRPDRFGREFATLPDLRPPLWAVRVTGALFHTQGGLAIDRQCRVLRADNGLPLPNLIAAGGAACGVSGSGDSGYLSGNGLLSAVTMGRIAGATAAALRSS
jgi:fumarate reductase flavoprotein subunit